MTAPNLTCPHCSAPLVVESVTVDRPRCYPLTLERDNPVFVHDRVARRNVPSVLCTGCEFADTVSNILKEG